VWKTPAGKALIHIEQTARRTQLTVHEAVEPAFGAFLIENLPRLYEAFSARKTTEDSG
jgi:hypothetical protein